MKKIDKRRKIFLLLFLTLGLILRFNQLSQRSLWTDEFFTFFQSTGHGMDIKNLLRSLSHQQSPVLLKAKEFKALLKFDSHKSVKDVSNGLLNTDTHPPLYFWIIYFWMRLFGDGVLTLRCFSVLLGVFVIFLAYKVTRHLFNPQAAIFSALFVSLSPFCVRYSQEARAYSLVMALCLLSWLFILRLENYHKNSDAFYFSLFNSLGFYTHYFYIFISFAQFLYFSLAHRHNSARLRKFYLAFLGSILFFSPWFIPLILKGYNFYLTEWIFGYPGLSNKLYYLFSGISRYVVIWDVAKMPLGLFLLIGICLFISLLLSAFKDMLTKYPRQSLFCLILFLAPLLGMFCLDIIEHGALLRQERFWTFPLLGFIPLAGYSLNYGFFKNRLRVYIIILFMLASSLVISKVQFGPAPKYASLWINKASQGKPIAVIVYNIRSVVFAQSYYLDDDVYLIPVLDQEQLKQAIKTAANYLDKLFIARHYHPSDASLMNQPFMEIKETNSVFKFKTAIDKNAIKVSEFDR